MRTRSLPILFWILSLAPGAMAQDSAELKSLCDAFWESNMKASPLWATSLGDHRYDDQLGDISPEGYAARRAELEGFLARAEEFLPKELSGGDRVTLNALLFELRSDIARLDCEMYLWNLSSRSGPQTSLMNIASYHLVPEDHKSARAMVQRWRQFADWTEQYMENLRMGIAQGKTANREMVERVITMIKDIESTPKEEWAMLKTPVEAVPEDWSSQQKLTFEAGIRTGVMRYAKALTAYREFLETELLPAAREVEQAGLSHVPGGDACYQSLIFQYTTLDLTPEEIHEIGLQEVEKVNQETRELGMKVLGTDDLEEIHEKLRNDPELHFDTRDEVQAKAEEALARAREAMPDYFGVLPEAPCTVVRMEAHEEKYSTIAYYRGPAADGSQPGRYFINTYAPETRPRYEAEALAFHEAIPGHHLQIAIAQELDELPKFRRHGGTTAFVEGWGLYTERLSDEMGLYSSDMDRLGMLSYDSWRACRLVVDTGLHAMGWTRQQAIDFMVKNTSLAENNIANEVDRYITTPGQALAYKLGQREIFRLRAMAKEELGDKFDIKDFHDVVLTQGAVDLRTLGQMVEAYIAERR